MFFFLEKLHTKSRGKSDRTALEFVTHERSGITLSRKVCLWAGSTVITCCHVGGHETTACLRFCRNIENVNQVCQWL